MYPALPKLSSEEEVKAVSGNLLSHPKPRGLEHGAGKKSKCQVTIYFHLLWAIHSPSNPK